MSDAGRREAWVFTAACLIVAGASVASGVSPSLEAVLNRWVGVPILVVGVVVAARLLIRSLWLSWLIHLEATRPLRPDEVKRPEREET